MKILRPVLIVTFFAIVALAVFAKFSKKSANDVNAKIDTTPVGQILAKDMELNYPANPRDVVVFYSDIIKAFYGEKYTDEQLTGLAVHARAMFDEELLDCNSYDVYMDNLKSEIAQYKENKKIITQYVVQRNADLEFFIDDGKSYCRVKTIYYTSEGTSTRSEVYEQYTLRKTGDDWKILFWEVIPKTVIKGD